jgi:hypothetical protein
LATAFICGLGGTVLGVIGGLVLRRHRSD